MNLRLLLSLFILSSVALGCSADDDCNDGADNDGDGLIDSADPGCAFNGDREAPDPVNPACGDSIDNDSDGLIDTDDPGCMDSNDDDEFNAPLSACQDGIDNDSDGLIDYPNDPGCEIPLKDNETDSCPDGENCPACGNGIDDDEDALIDYPNDPGCDSAGDPNEFNGDPSTCGTAVLIQDLPESGSVTGQIQGMQPNELISSVCGGTGEEQVYVFEPTTARSLVITTDFPETEIDTVVYMRSTCRDPQTELGCNDDDGLNVSIMTIDRVEPGTYFIVVDTQSSTTQGNYRLDVIEYTPEKGTCNSADSDCAPGLVCRRFVDGGVMAGSETCEQPECSDGQDSDGDGLADYPEEPGCESPEDNDESDSCPGVDDCAACSNGLDDDNDTLSDYGSDPGCSFAGDNLEIDECIDGVLILELDDAGATGTTPPSSAGSNFTQTCDSTTTTTTEHVYAYRNSRDLTSLSFSSNGSAGETVLSVRANECSNGALQEDCDNPSGGGANVTVAAPVVDQFYYVFVDGDISSEIDYMLNVSGRIVSGADCVQGDEQFTCTDGYFCDGSDTCVPTACNDGDDNDMDTFTDYPADPGCQDINDTDEGDTCPGSDPACPQCGNGLDDDEDMLIDYPSDLGCEAASDNLELDDCTAGVPLLSLTDSGVTGTTEAAGNSDFEPSCSSATSSEDEYAYLNNRLLTSISFSTIGSAGDTVLSVRKGQCDLATDELACLQSPNGGEVITLDAPAQGDIYYVFVDGDFESGIDYMLNVAGTLGDGQACVDSDTQFVCDASEGLLCIDSICSASECSDLVSNDADGLIDAMDPGCASLIDNNEADDPAEAPQCADMVDNDSDGDIDYPADIGCQRAADDNEVSCTDSDPVVTVTTSPITGDTSSATDDFSPSCQSNSSAKDIAHELIFPGELESLSLSTGGSSFDTVLYFREGVCTAEDYACNDDTGGLQSALELENVAAGLYYIMVDAYTSGQGAYTLTVNGVIKSGEACDADQITAGILACTAGTTCTAGTCTP